MSKQHVLVKKGGISANTFKSQVTPSCQENFGTESLQLHKMNSNQDLR